MHTLYGSFWSLLPALVAIATAIITREVYASLFCGVMLGALLVGGFHPWHSFNAFFETMIHSVNLEIIIFDLLIGIILALLAHSGAIQAYGRFAAKHIHNKKQAVLATYGLGAMIFMDAHLNCITIGSVMRSITDRFKVSRAKLAYIIDASAAPVCILVPLSSWAIIFNSYVPANSEHSGFELFVSSIPYNYYAILTVFMILIVTLKPFDFGAMRLHEFNAANGDLYTSHRGEYEIIHNPEKDDAAKGRIWDMMLPLAVLFLSALAIMVYSGFEEGAATVSEAFAKCEPEICLIFAAICTILYMGVTYIPRKVISLKTFFGTMQEAVDLMAHEIVILIFAWTLKGMGDELGLSQFIGSFMEGMDSNLVLVPVFIFFIALGLTFATGTAWGTFAFMVPIITSLFPAREGKLVSVTVAALLSGAVCGDHISPISDTTIMSSSSAHCNHINHVETQSSYAAVVAFISAGAFLMAAWTENMVFTLIVAIVVLFAVVEAITLVQRYKDSRRKA